MVDLNVTARDRDWNVSPILGFSFNWVHIKGGDIHVRGYDTARTGTQVNMCAGFGVRVIQGFYVDGGANFFKDVGFSPFLRLTWPLY